MKLETHDMSKLFAVVEPEDVSISGWRWCPGLIVSLKSRGVTRIEDNGAMRIKMKDPPFGLLIAFEDGRALVLWTLATL